VGGRDPEPPAWQEKLTADANAAVEEDRPDQSMIAAVCAWCPSVNILRMQRRDTDAVIIYQHAGELRIFRNGHELQVTHGICQRCKERLEVPRDRTFQERPRIVCLCGSTRFYQQFVEANYRETMEGHIVLSVGFYPHAEKEMHHEERGCTAQQKLALDELHKRKIDLADEVLVLNVGGYIGSSTRSEVEYAETHGKVVRYLEKL
jgi:hypothetical protein